MQYQYNSNNSSTATRFDEQMRDCDTWQSLFSLVGGRHRKHLLYVFLVSQQMVMAKTTKISVRLSEYSLFVAIETGVRHLN